MRPPASAGGSYFRGMLTAFYILCVLGSIAGGFAVAWSAIGLKRRPYKDRKKRRAEERLMSLILEESAAMWVDAEGLHAANKGPK